ncbi:hypothetical protein [Nonomuraea rhodomycinica]|uniref:Alpha/beta hydrolase n=1 Tax=Nonomuraea rhodomycinica TaxID=1712872 RepID=A0A7Y6IV67_9ACTN|nr:hypothetical protein [Nonomuraea rhodomycinica]NUW43689.1 hypothetical protein [Nonomuraea rhodomycinica]
MVPLTDEAPAAVTVPVLVPGGGHSVAFDVPDLVNARILEHAGRVAGELGLKTE